jgi:membrane-associated phospholipid phosphatase
MTAGAHLSSHGSMAVRSLTRPYPITAPMVVLMALVPLYIFIARAVSGGPAHRPTLPLDGTIPLLPTWALVYGALYFVLIVLPILIVREDAHLRRMFYTYLSVWLVAYGCFLVYPTAAPRPPHIVGTGFAEWGLQLLYSSDPPYNCFPSLHVAHSVVSAMVCYRVHRRVGILAMLCAALVALSTLFTKQHYVLDVVAGAFVAFLAQAIFFRGLSRASVPDADRRVAPIFAAAMMTLATVGIFAAWLVYHLRLAV